MFTLYSLLLLFLFLENRMEFIKRKSTHAENSDEENSKKKAKVAHESQNDMSDPKISDSISHPEEQKTVDLTVEKETSVYVSDVNDTSSQQNNTISKIYDVCKIIFLTMHQISSEREVTSLSIDKNPDFNKENTCDVSKNDENDTKVDLQIYSEHNIENPVTVENTNQEPIDCNIDSKTEVSFDEDSLANENDHCVLPVESDDYTLDFFPINSENSVYVLSVVFNDALYRGNISVDSHYIDIYDMIRILKGAEFIGESVTANLKMDYIMDKNNLLITVRTEFRLRANLKPIPELFIFCLDKIEKNTLLDNVQILKKKLNFIEQETMHLGKRFCLSQNFCDSLKMPLAYSFHFRMQITAAEKYSVYCLELKHCPTFTEFLVTNPRFQKVLQYFSNGQFRFIVDTGSKCTEVQKATSQKCKEENHPYTCTDELLISWKENDQFYLTHKSPREILEYIESKKKKSNTFFDLELINAVLITVFELNLEFELRDMQLLKPSMYPGGILENQRDAPQYQYKYMPGVYNYFNILEYITRMPSFNDQCYFNPSIGFYKCPIF